MTAFTKMANKYEATFDMRSFLSLAALLPHFVLLCNTVIAHHIKIEIKKEAHPVKGRPLSVGPVTIDRPLCKSSP